MRGTALVAAALAAVVLSVSTSYAAPHWGLKTDLAGVPQVLRTSTVGWDTDPAGHLGSTTDGYLYGFDGSGSGWEFHVLDPTLESPNNAATPAEVANVRLWDTTRNLYAASVKSGVKDMLIYSDGVTRAMPGTNAFFTWSGGGTATVNDLRFEDPFGDYKADSGEAAKLSTGSTDAGAGGQHKCGLALIGETGAGTDTWMVVGGNGGVGDAWLDYANNSLRKMEFGPLTGIDRDNGVVGTRAITNGGRLTDGGGSASGLLADLVPGANDLVRELAYNPADSNLYFISFEDVLGDSDESNDRVFLSAVSFEWAPGGDFANDSVATAVDLDPNSANDYLELTYDATANPAEGATPGQSLRRSYGLTFSPDGSVLYVGNGAGGNDRVFQFVIVPEPATVALIGLGLAGLAARRRKAR